MPILNVFFKWLLNKSKKEIKRLSHIENFEAYKKLSVETNSSVTMIFEIMKDRRRKSLLSTTKTIIIKIIIPETHSHKLNYYNNMSIIIYDVPFGRFFNDDLITNTLIDYCADQLLKEVDV